MTIKNWSAAKIIDLIWLNDWFWSINSKLVQIALALIIILLPLPPMMRRMPERIKGGVPYISCRLHTTATPASPSLINPMVCTSHTASDWSLTDEESAGEKPDLDNRGQETWSLTHVYSLHVSVLKYGYKGVFVKARAAPAFNQTFGLRLYESSNPDTHQPTQQKCSFSISGPIISSKKDLYLH